MDYDWVQEHVGISNLLTRLEVIADRVAYFGTKITYTFFRV